jgi:hypothetical protein
MRNCIRGAGVAAALLFLLAPLAAHAGSITPASYSATIGVGDSVTVSKTVTTDATKVADIFFLADNTGSMSGVITSMKSVASTLLTDLASTYADAHFGVGHYYGDVSETGGPGYSLQQGLSNSTGAAQTQINAWNASGGGDTPEANLDALRHVASDVATGWRDTAAKVVVWFGDAPGHTETTDLPTAIAALVAEGVNVIALNSSGGGTGIDGTYDGAANQASTIAAATGGSLFNNFTSVPVGSIASTIEGLIGAATSNLSLAVLGGVPAGLDIAFTCTSVGGCSSVPGGESRTFDMTITGLTAGSYSFTVYSPGVDGAVETDDITVGAVPEPGTLLLLGSGIVGFLARRRRVA